MRKPKPSPWPAREAAVIAVLGGAEWMTLQDVLALPAVASLFAGRRNHASLLQGVRNTLLALAAAGRIELERPPRGHRWRCRLPPAAARPNVQKFKSSSSNHGVQTP
jgi:hypothetical protein